MNTITRFWGRDGEHVQNRLPKGIEYFVEESGTCAVKMSTEGVRSLVSDDETVVTSKMEHDKLTIAIVTLKHPDIEEPITFESSFGVGYPAAAAIFMFEEGNYSCDCNKSIFINRHTDYDVPEAECGDTIKLESIEIREDEIVWSVTGQDGE